MHPSPMWTRNVNLFAPALPAAFAALTQLWHPNRRLAIDSLPMNHLLASASAIMMHAPQVIGC